MIRFFYLYYESFSRLLSRKNLSVLSSWSFAFLYITLNFRKLRFTYYQVYDSQRIPRVVLMQLGRILAVFLNSLENS